MKSRMMLWKSGRVRQEFHEILLIGLLGPPLDAVNRDGGMNTSSRSMARE